MDYLADVLVAGDQVDLATQCVGREYRLLFPHLGVVEVRALLDLGVKEVEFIEVDVSYDVLLPWIGG